MVLNEFISITQLVTAEPFLGALPDSRQRQGEFNKRNRDSFLDECIRLKVGPWRVAGLVMVHKGQLKGFSIGISLKLDITNFMDFLLPS